MRGLFLGTLLICGELMAVTSELSVAREALRDGLWGVARKHAAMDPSPAAKLVVLESLAGESRWDEVAKRLEGWKQEKGEGFDYYRAVVRGDHAEAMRILKTGGSPEGLVEARLYEAGELMKGGDRERATAIWREIASLTNVSERALTVASVNLGDASVLRKAYERVRAAAYRRQVAVRLGGELLKNAATAEEGAAIVRAVVSDSPDTEGARAAFLQIADAKIAAAHWQEALDVYTQAVEIWPETAKLSCVHEGRGWALWQSGRPTEALEAFRMAEKLATDDAGRAVAMLKEGDVLFEMACGEEAMKKYREVLARYAEVPAVKKSAQTIRMRELELKGRELYKEYRFEAARKAFSEVAAKDPVRRPRMDFFEVLCLYGEGRDVEAAKRAATLSASSSDGAVRAEVTLWLAKFSYNRREWKNAVRLFVAYVEAAPEGEGASEALLWGARAAFADNDFAGAIRLSTRLIEKYPDSPEKAQALMVQGETLIEQARFDEALLVFERVVLADKVSSADRLRAQILKADALYAMGADNAARYTAALDAYSALRFGGMLTPSDEIVVSFKIARVLEKLKRLDEAIDQYYVRVVLAYRKGRQQRVRFDDEARAAFSRAAFRLVDEYEGRGRRRQAENLLELVAASDVPAAAEAVKRLERMSKKGGFL